MHRVGTAAEGGVPSLPLRGCVTLGKLYHLPNLSFLICKLRIKTSLNIKYKPRMKTPCTASGAQTPVRLGTMVFAIQTAYF